MGITQALFEGSMFIMVFLWTPFLEAAAGKANSVPHGLTFAIFMVAIMVGSKLFGIAVGTYQAQLATLGAVAMAVGALAFWAIVWLELNAGGVLAAFVLFELACGLYFPAVGTQKGKLVPESVRSTMTNIFRMGVNIIVISSLLQAGHTTPKLLFACCFLMLTAALGAQLWLRRRDAQAATSLKAVDGDT